MAIKVFEDNTNYFANRYWKERRGKGRGKRGNTMDEMYNNNGRDKRVLITIFHKIPQRVTESVQPHVKSRTPTSGLTWAKGTSTLRRFVA